MLNCSHELNHQKYPAVSLVLVLLVQCTFCTWWEENGLTLIDSETEEPFLEHQEGLLCFWWSNRFTIPVTIVLR